MKGAKETATDSSRRESTMGSGRIDVGDQGKTKMASIAGAKVGDDGLAKGDAK